MKSDFLQLIEQLAGALLIITVLADVFLRSFTRGSAPGLSTTVSRAGPTPTDFVTALYVGGSSVSIVITSDIAPKTAGFRLFFLINSLIGTSIVSLTVTYLLQVYTALRQRNTLGLKLQVLSRQTGDAAELVAGLGPRGQFESGYTIMGSRLR